MGETQLNVIDFLSEKNRRSSTQKDGAWADGQSPAQLDPQYQRLIDRMNKIELLEEMVRFQEERSERGSLTFGLMVRGRILFGKLESASETEELRILAGSYKRHLEYEMVAYQKSIQPSQN